MSNKHDEFKSKYKDGFTSENIDAALIDFNDTFCVAELDRRAIDRADAKQTGKGYSTTGIKVSWIWDDLIRVFGPTKVKTTVDENEYQGDAWESGGFEVCYRVTISILDSAGEILAEQWAFGGHKAKMLGDARKGALTNGAKKALSLLGIGLGAWKGLLDEDARVDIAGEYTDGLGRDVNTLHYETLKKELVSAMQEYEALNLGDPCEKFFKSQEAIVKPKDVMKIRAHGTKNKDRRPWLTKIFKEVVDEIKAHYDAVSGKTESDNFELTPEEMDG